VKEARKVLSRLLLARNLVQAQAIRPIAMQWQSLRLSLSAFNSLWRFPVECCVLKAYLLVKLRLFIINESQLDQVSPLPTRTPQ